MIIKNKETEKLIRIHDKDKKTRKQKCDLIFDAKMRGKFFKLTSSWHKYFIVQ